MTTSSDYGVGVSEGMAEGIADDAATGSSVRGCAWEDVESALRRGWKVFPVWGVRGVEGQRGECACPKGKDCGEPGKHPAVSGGFLAAIGQEDAYSVADWWRESNGERNLGIRTGSASGLLVTDVDIRAGGADSYDAWESWTGLEGWPGGGRVHTGRGGAESVGAGGHWYLRWPEEWVRLGRVVGGKIGVLPGIDIRSDGGYVLGPGSAHVAGGRYQWLPGWGGRELPVASEEFMSWLRDARSGGVGSRGGSGPGSGGAVAGYSFRDVRKAEVVGAGGRDAYFNDLAFRLRLARFSWDRAEAEMRKEWERTEQPVGDVYPWETALGKLERVWATVPEGGPPQEVPRSTPGSAEPTEPTEHVTTEVTGAVSGGGAPLEPLSGDIVTSTQQDGEGNHDTGNGLRYVRLFRDRARYVREMGQWFLWDETDGIWKLDKVGRALEWTKEVVGDIRAEAEVARLDSDSDNAAKWYKWAHTTSALARRKTLLESASVEEGIRTEVEELDAGRWLMALRGGQTIDLETGTVRASHASDLMTRCAGVSWEEVAAVGPQGWRGGAWERHVLRMVKGDQEAAAWMRRMAGYCLTGSVEEQSMAIMHGNGENGKNVFMETLCAVWGDYAIKAQAGILTAADDEHPVGLYGLRGARLVFVDEVGRARINETRLKDITGGAVQRARDIGASWVEFEMRGKVWVAANSLPAIKDSSHGMWRRIRNVPLYGQLGKDGWIRENGFADHLQKECRGEVMAWALAGLAEWRATGLGTYPEMDRMSAQYRDEEDMFGLFIRECLIVEPLSDPPLEGGAPAEWTNQRALYSTYTFWCHTSQDRKDKVLNYSYFGRELRKALPGIKTERGREDGERVQRVYGVKLKSVN
jgi:putative DNA primase/helicase